MGNNKEDEKEKWNGDDGGGGYSQRYSSKIPFML